MHNVGSSKVLILKIPFDIPIKIAFKLIDKSVGAKLDKMHNACVIIML